VAISRFNHICETILRTSAHKPRKETNSCFIIQMALPTYLYECGTLLKEDQRRTLQTAEMKLFRKWLDSDYLV
jgi:hypothetical protein